MHGLEVEVAMQTRAVGTGEVAWSDMCMVRMGEKVDI